MSIHLFTCGQFNLCEDKRGDICLSQVPLLALALRGIFKLVKAECSILVPTPPPADTTLLANCFKKPLPHVWMKDKTFSD